MSLRSALRIPEALQQASVNVPQSRLIHSSFRIAACSSKGECSKQDDRFDSRSSESPLLERLSSVLPLSWGALRNLSAIGFLILLSGKRGPSEGLIFIFLRLAQYGPEPFVQAHTYARLLEEALIDHFLAQSLVQTREYAAYSVTLTYQGAACSLNAEEIYQRYKAGVYNGPDPIIIALNAVQPDWCDWQKDVFSHDHEV